MKKIPLLLCIFLCAPLYSNPFVGDWDEVAPHFYDGSAVKYSKMSELTFQQDGWVQQLIHPSTRSLPSLMLQEYSYTGDTIIIDRVLYQYRFLSEYEIVLFRIGTVPDVEYGTIIFCTEVAYLVRPEYARHYPILAEKDDPLRNQY